MVTTNTAKKKKVLFLITKSNWGGAQRYVYDLAKNLPEETYDVAVAVGDKGALIEKLQADHIRVIPIAALQRDISFSKEIKASREILAILKTEKPDVLHINSSKAGLFGALLGRIAGVPKIIFTAHGWAFNEDRPLPARLVLKYLHWLTVLLSHKTIAVSQALKNQMNWPLVKDKMTVIHNGRKTPDFLARDNARTFLIQQEPRLAEYQNDLWTGTIAELHPVKNHEMMIETVAELVAEGHQLRHLIIGGEANGFASPLVTSEASDGRSEQSEAGQGGLGEYSRKLKSLVIENNLENHVFLLGHIHEAAQYLKAFDIFTLTSRSEALGYVVIEALQAGLPIVASRVGGIPEIITDGESGILIEKDNSSQLAAALEKIIENKNLTASLSKAAKEREVYFSMTHMVGKTCIQYELL